MQQDGLTIDLTHSSWSVRLGFRVILSLEKIIARFSAVGDKMFYSDKEFPWVSDIESHWQEIRREAESLLEVRDKLPNFQEISKDQEMLTTDDNWKTFFLFGYGFKSANNCARCPETTKALEKVPGMKTAMFSILSPKKHIPPHRGPYKGVLRYHLGLIVPEPQQQCRLRVGNEYVHWQEGKSIIFDDTYIHEVWNDTDGDRVVLFVDIERPMRFPFALINKLIIALISRSSFVQDAKKNELAWEQQFESSQGKVA